MILIQSELPQEVTELDPSWRQGMPANTRLKFELMTSGDDVLVNECSSYPYPTMDGEDVSVDEFLDKVPAGILQLAISTDEDYRRVHDLSPDVQLRHEADIRVGLANNFNIRQTLLHALFARNRAKLAQKTLELKRSVTHIDQAHTLGGIDYFDGVYVACSQDGTVHVPGDFWLPSPRVGESLQSYSLQFISMFMLRAQTLGQPETQIPSDTLMRSNNFSVHFKPAHPHNPDTPRVFFRDVVSIESV